MLEESLDYLHEIYVNVVNENHIKLYDDLYGNI